MTGTVLFIESASGHEQPVTDEVAVATAQGLVQTLISLRKINRGISINCPAHLSMVKIAPDRLLKDVFATKDYADQWLLIKSVASNSPLSHGLDSWLETATNWDAKTANGIESAALLWAYLCKSGTVSLHTAPIWNEEWVSAVCSMLDAQGGIHTVACDIRNHSCHAHVMAHEDWLREINVGTGAGEIWRDREARYPGLRFVAGVRRQLAELAVIGAPYQQALETLETLNNDALVWQGQGAPNFSMKVAAGEHDQRRELVDFYDELTGGDRSFGRHAYFTGGFAGRIHFIADAEEKKFVVGYVGKKL